MALLVCQVVSCHAGRVASIGAGGFTARYAELFERVNQIMHMLCEDMGLVPGKRVLLCGANTTAVKFA